MFFRFWLGICVFCGFSCIFLGEFFLLMCALRCDDLFWLNTGMYYRFNLAIFHLGGTQMSEGKLESFPKIQSFPKSFRKRSVKMQGVAYDEHGRSRSRTAQSLQQLLGQSSLFGDFPPIRLEGRSLSEE